MTPAAGTRRKAEVPGWAWPSCGPSPATMAGRRTSKAGPRACTRSSVSRWITRQGAAELRAVSDPGETAPRRRLLPAAPGKQGDDRDRGEQQGQVGDGQVEQAHRGGIGARARDP